MAEMTAAEAIRMALRFNQFDVAGVITRMTTQLDGMKQKESAYKQVIESKKALIEQQAQEIERLNKSLQFEQNYLSRVGTHGPDCYKWGPGHWDCAMQEIERLKETWPNNCGFKDDDGCCLFPGAMTPECHADVCGVIRDLKQEVVRKNRVIYVACQRLARRSDGYYGVENWLAWLEKEAEVQG